MISKLSRFGKIRVLFISLLLVAFNVKADHYYGGYISYTHISGFKYEVTVVTYADNSKVNSDRDSVNVIWGDGIEEYVQRTNNNGNGETVFPGIKKNIYKGEHIFTKEGNYQLVFVDNFRPYDILNIEAGKSGSTLLYFDAIIPVADTVSFCQNNAPSFLSEPYMFGKPGEDYFLSLTHFDIDGDSLSFKLISPKATNAYSVPGYYTPDRVSIDEKTGLFSWIDPPFGNYVFAYEIEEYRNGQLIGVSVADFPVFIKRENKTKGAFSDVNGTTDGSFHFNSAEEIELNISYENFEADATFIKVVTGLVYNINFIITNNASSTANVAYSLLKIDYLGNDFAEGAQIITFKAGSIYGSDTIFDYKSISITTASNQVWRCSVPPNVKDVVEIIPLIPVFEVISNLFDESVWMNVGENFEDFTIEVLDLRGRRVYKDSNLESATFKLDLSHFKASMYLFRIIRDDKVITTLKAVKK